MKNIIILISAAIACFKVLFYSDNRPPWIKAPLFIVLLKPLRRCVCPGLIDNSLCILYKGRTIRKLMGGGGGEVQEKNSRNGKFNLKKFLHAN